MGEEHYYRATPERGSQEACCTSISTPLLLNPKLFHSGKKQTPSSLVQFPPFFSTPPLPPFLHSVCRILWLLLVIHPGVLLQFSHVSKNKRGPNTVLSPPPPPIRGSVSWRSCRSLAGWTGRFKPNEIEMKYLATHILLILERCTSALHMVDRPALDPAEEQALFEMKVGG